MSDIECDDEETVKLLAHANSLLTGATNAEILISYYDTLKEFFSGSNRWMESLGFMVIPDTLDYPLNVVTGRIMRLLNVIDQNNVPQAAVMPEIGTVHFLYPYSQTQPMMAIVAKNVTHPFKDGKPASPPIPDWVLADYGVGILEGVVGKMMAEDGQSYSNPQKANFYMLRFRNAVSQARADAMRMSMVGSQAWAFPQQFRTVNQKSGISTFNVNPTPMTVR